jgi:release factor glutamine methyltransferase
MPTIAEVLQQASAKLRTAEVLNDLLDAQTLLAHALGKERTYLIIHYNQILAEDLLATYQALIDRRAAGEPLQYIVGHQEFYGLEFEVTPAVLIPRPETELIIEETIRLAANLSEPLIIDVGTGSGCIAVTLARELETARVIATDISANALQVARRNAQRHGLSDRVQFVETDLLNGLAIKADFILSNPPYIASHEMPTLQREVRDWEPHTALTDFGDGLQFYRRLLDEAPARLKPNGVLMFEVGYQQAETIKAFVNRAVWHEPKALRDLQQIERTLMITLK